MDAAVGALPRALRRLEVRVEAIVAVGYWYLSLMVLEEHVSYNKILMWEACPDSAADEAAGWCH